MAKNNFKVEIDLNVVDPKGLSPEQLRSESTVGKPTTPSSSAYKDLGPDPLFNARIENFLRTFNTEFFKNKEAILTPALTRDIAIRAKKAKDQESLNKIIEDEITRQLKYLKDFQAGILNPANTLGTTAQVKLENIKSSEEPDQQLISFYEDKINEIKSTESKLGQYFQESENKVSNDLKTIANKAFNEGYNERLAQSITKVKKEEQDVLNRYQKQFDKSVREKWEQVASQVAFNVAQEFITNKEREKANPQEYRPESKRLYSTVKADIEKYRPTEPELSREAILERYQAQGKFLPEDFRPNIGPGTVTSSFLPPGKLLEVFPENRKSQYGQLPSDDFFKFIMEFNRGDKKTGQEFLNFFKEQNQPVPQDLSKFLSQKFFSAEGGNVKGPSITNANRERIATQLNDLMTSISGGGFKPPSKPPTTSPGGPEEPELPPNMANLKYAASSMSKNPAIESVLAVNNLIMNGLEPVKKALSTAAQATSKGGIKLSELSGNAAAGITGTGTVLGGLIGGIVGIPGGPAGIAGGIATGSALGTAGGTAAGSSFEITSILSQIEENTSERITAFSPEVLAEKLDNQLSMLQLQLNTAKQYGGDIAELDNAANNLRQQMYKVGVELLIAFKPFILDVVTLLSMLIDAVKLVGTGVAYFREWTKWFDPLFGPFVQVATFFYSKENKKNKKQPLMSWIDPAKGLMKNRPQGLKP
jgi:hypothetical protein